jgi:hypothetical protein
MTTPELNALTIILASGEDMDDYFPLIDWTAERDRAIVRNKIKDAIEAPPEYKSALWRKVTVWLRGRTGSVFPH